MTTVPLPARIVTAASSDDLFRALAVCHAAARPTLPARIARPIAAAHRLHALNEEAGAAHRSAEGRNRLREVVDGLKAAAVEGRPITLGDAAGVAEHEALIADLRRRVESSTTAAREAGIEATAACSPATLAPLLERALEGILDEAEESAAVMSGAERFDWGDPAAVHRQPKPIQAAFFRLCELGDHRDHILAAVAALAWTHRGWTPAVHGIGFIPPGRHGIAETGHPAHRLIKAVAARAAAADPS